MSGFTLASNGADINADLPLHIYSKEAPATTAPTTDAKGHVSGSSTQNDNSISIVERKTLHEQPYCGNFRPGMDDIGEGQEDVSLDSISLRILPPQTNHSGQDKVEVTGKDAEKPVAEKPYDKMHKRSVSHMGVMFSRDPPFEHEKDRQIPLMALNGAAAPLVCNLKGHARSQSQGQVPAIRGHKREGSRAEFILPEGHEQRERERELRPAKSFIKRSSLQIRGHVREASRTESVYTIRDQKKTLLEKLCFWRERRNETSTRLIVPNTSSESADQNSMYPGNQICTTKYTLLSFVPKNLFEQFHRFANLYFLFIVLLNFVPLVNAYAKELAVIPLLFVLSVTAIKDAFEDWRRFKSDKKVNGNRCRIFSSSTGCYVDRTWKDVKVGDIVHLVSEEVIPADVVLLNSSDEFGVCYIESSNLDGETNLKQRQSVKGFGGGDKFEPSKFNFVLEVGPPTTKMYHFVGSVPSRPGLPRRSGANSISMRSSVGLPPLRFGDNIPLSKDNLILRDCIVKNTDFVEGIVVYAGRETKALLNNGGTRYKRSKLERQMNREVIWCVGILIVICLFSALGSGLWQHSILEVNSLSKIIYFLPTTISHNGLSVDYVDLNSIWVAFTSFWTFIILYQVLIPISLYVTIEVVKLIQVYHIHVDKDFEDKETGMNIVCRALNITEELGQVQYIFTDKTGTLTENKMIFQRCSINGKDYGHEAVTLTTNKSVSETFLTNSELQEEVRTIEAKNSYSHSGSDVIKSDFVKLNLNSSQEEDYKRLRDFFFTLAACNTVIVAKQKHNQLNSSLNQFLDSSLAFRTKDDLDCSVNQVSFAGTEVTVLSYEDSSPKSFNYLSNFLPHYRWKPSKIDNSISTIEGTGSLSSSTSSKNQSSRPPSSLSCDNENSKPKFEAESPDELALVGAAYKYGFKLIRRNIHGAAVSIPGQGVCEFQVLHVLPFDSNRKRMSIIIWDPETAEKILYCKGADSAILENLAVPTNDATVKRIEETQRLLTAYSKTGLRVLCMAKRVLSEDEYEKWKKFHDGAENSLANREQKLNSSYCDIERNMELLGATGIEDRLQDGVPETISALRKAGIVVWVLTGDKQETAINIAYSCALFSLDMEILTLSARTRDQTERTIQCFLAQIEQEESLGILAARPKTKERGLVIDGRTLVYILDKRANLRNSFLALACKCNAVMCCRATPLQKALIVRTVKDKLKVLTLAIGDGANDVSMIQTADVGIGISGVEGRQAVMSSDFAITRFKHLEKLILVHGRWCYDRLSRIILYFFYKNVSFVFLLMWYQLYCGFSGSVMFDDLYLVVFNLLFTSWPPVTLGTYDQDAPAELLLSEPKLYAKSRLGQVYSPRSFWLNIADGIYQSIVIFFLTASIYNQSNAGVYEFGMTVTHACVSTQLLHIALDTKSWTVIQIGGILLSYSVFYIFGLLYTVLCSGCMGLPSQYGELVKMVTTPKHWFCLVLIWVVALTPRLVYRTIKASLFPDDLTKALLERRTINKGRFVGPLSIASSISSVYRDSTYL